MIWKIMKVVPCILVTACVLSVHSQNSFPTAFCITWESNDNCLGGEAALTNTEIRTSYRYPRLDNSSIAGPVIARRDVGSSVMYELESPAIEVSTTQSLAEYTFVQTEHGGGVCNCASIYINCNINSSRIHVCDGSASVSRRVRASWSPGESLTISNNLPEEIKLSPFLLHCTHLPYIKASFWIRSTQCEEGDGTEVFEEGVVFSIRAPSISNEWIPLQMLYFETMNNPFGHIDFTERRGNDFTIRGYPVTQQLVSESGDEVLIEICNITSTNSVQFRWLQTGLINPSKSNGQDLWGLDDVQIVYISDSENSTLLNETFSDSHLNDQRWPEANVRDARISTYCNKENVLLFGSRSGNAVPTYQNLQGETVLVIQSTSILTKAYSLTSQEISDQIVSLKCDNHSKVIINVDTDILTHLQTTIDSKVIPSTEFIEITNEKSLDVKISRVRNITLHCNIHVVVLSYLFKFLSECVASTRFSSSILEELIDLATNILKMENFFPSQTSLSAGTTILSCFDFLLLEYVPRTGIYITPNIILQSEIVNLNSSMEPISAINTSRIPGFDGPTITLTIPIDFLRVFDDGDGFIRIVTAIFQSASSLLLFGQPNGTVFGSGIVAATLQCGNGSCPTNAPEYVSTLNISISFEHSEDTKKLVEVEDLEIKCVFLEIISRNNSVFTIGQWSTRGCTRNMRLSSLSRTVCDCNHLTHFAILLSPRPPEFSEPVTLSLMIIGYIGVVISVIAMLLTIFTFTALRSLHSMRNYIHVHLCINLSIAQIIFVAGVDKTGAGVPFHCQLVAVLLHYFFLVSFMWMLMEGVVLYVALVIVFVKNNKYYVIGFTAASYGIPFLYMAILTLPLGFGHGNEDNYGTVEACFLSHRNNFIWAFIAPVILIFVANISFFVMAARIMWFHHMKNTDKERIQNVRHWFQSAVSVVIVMGLTWITGILIIVVDELVPLAYIFTIMVAFQGLFIFLIFVVFSKAVRNAYTKWWKVKISEYDFLSKYFSKDVSSSQRCASKTNAKTSQEVKKSDTKDNKEK